jgi:glycosyltransferase involved in cell wall biosynthesis
MVTEACSGTEYPAALAKLKIDIALSPLAHTEFNKSRSALKLYEFAAVGAVTIASDYGELGSAIQDGSTGFLVDNQPDSWLRAIRRLVRSDDLRLQLLEAARNESQSHDIGVTAPRLLEALQTTQPDRNRTVFAFPKTQTTRCSDVDVIMPVSNQSSLASRTWEAVQPELNANHRLIVVADISTQPEAASVLDEISERPWVTVDRTHRHPGVLDAFNFAMQELVRPNADVILMKADAVPMPGFISRLAEAAGSNAAIGTVSAVSNNGSIASVPDLRDALELTATMQTPLLVAPTISSHLLYIKRQVFEKHGVFDAEFSSEGAAEIDLSLRIIEDYANVIDPGCWCKRTGSPAFRELVKLSTEDRALLDQKHPTFRLQEAVYRAPDPLMPHRVKMIAATRDARPRVLQVLHSYVGGGGTEKHVQDLESAIADQFLSFGAAPHDTLKLYCGTMPVAAWPYEKAGWPLTSSNVPANDPAWLDILQQVKPSLIHFHHLLNHPLSLLTKLSGTGIPIIVSIHDYYFLCPDYHLQHCPGVHSCDTCFPQQFKGPAQYQALRRDLLSGSLRAAAAIVAPSQAAANLMRDVYPDLTIRVIPHGIHNPEGLHRAVQRLRGAQRPTEKIRFGMIGNLLPVKGIEVIFKVWPLVARQNSAELHIYGTSDPMYVERCAELGIHYHGPYTATDLPHMLSEIDIGILPAQARETFSYTLSEFFAAGIPVIGSDYGALSDRVEQGVNGLKVAPTDIQAWIEAISLAASDAALRERLKRDVRLPNSLDHMGAEYTNLYREVLQRAGKAPLDSGNSLTLAVPQGVA